MKDERCTLGDHAKVSASERLAVLDEGPSGDFGDAEALDVERRETGDDFFFPSRVQAVYGVTPEILEESE